MTRKNSKRFPSYLERFREHPHACITLSDAGTWGSAEQDDSDSGSTEEPNSEDSTLESATDSEDLSVVMDDDWAIQGGTTDPEAPPEEVVIHLLRQV